MTKYTLHLSQIRKEDTQRCGGKGDNLGELTSLGVRVPPAYCVIADALPHLIEANHLEARIGELAAQIDFDDLPGADRLTGEIRDLLAGAAIPHDLDTEIRAEHRALVSPANPYVAVRSSVAVRDSAISSFPGMMDTYHYVLGETELMERIRECWASLWTARAAFARHRQGITHDRGLIAPVIQLMVNADCAGVLFTANPITGAEDQIIVESNFGLGESVVSGRAMTDFFRLEKEGGTVAERRIARKNLMVVMDEGRGSGRVEQPVPPELATEPSLSDAMLGELAETSGRIARHFGFGIDMEWAFQDGLLYILQARKIRLPDR